MIKDDFLKPRPGSRLREPRRRSQMAITPLQKPNVDKKSTILQEITAASGSETFPDLLYIINNNRFGTVAFSEWSDNNSKWTKCASNES